MHGASMWDLQCPGHMPKVEALYLAARALQKEGTWDFEFAYEDEASVK